MSPLRPLLVLLLAISGASLSGAAAQGSLRTTGSYIISARIVVVPRDASPRELNVAVGVAASINCTTTFIPPKTGDVPLPRPGDAFDRKRHAESDDLDYNVQLGTQYAHTPSGDLYYLDRATMWNETGPDGPGYYKKNGNDIIKLIPGVP